MDYLLGDLICFQIPNILNTTASPWGPILPWRGEEEQDQTVRTWGSLPKKNDRKKLHDENAGPPSFLSHVTQQLHMTLVWGTASDWVPLLFSLWDMICDLLSGHHEKSQIAIPCHAMHRELFSCFFQTPIPSNYSSKILLGPTPCHLWPNTSLIWVCFDLDDEFILTGVFSVQYLKLICVSMQWLFCLFFYQKMETNLSFM